MFKKEGNVLISVYARIIGISTNQTKEIIFQNGAAKLLLEQEHALELTSDLENLKILVRLTLLREYGDLSSLTLRDIQFVRESYNVQIEAEPKKEKHQYKSFEIIEIFEEERHTDHELSDLLKEFKNSN